MVHTPSRRAILASLGTGATALLAGCGGGDSTGTPTQRATPIEQYTAELTRSTGDRPPVRGLSGDRDTAGSDEATPTPEPTFSRTLASADDAVAVEFTDGATNVAAVRSLLTETTFTDECVFVYQTRVRACYRLQLNYVSRDPDGDPSFEFCTVIRDADVACERERTDYVAAFVRLPFPGEEVGGYSVGRGSSCDPVPGDAERVSRRDWTQSPVAARCRGHGTHRHARGLYVTPVRRVERRVRPVRTRRPPG
jgi:hypothetical protein